MAASGLDYTIVRPGGLTDEPGSGRVRVGEDLGTGTVPRADVAALLAAVLAERRGHRQGLRPARAATRRSTRPSAASEGAARHRERARPGGARPRPARAGGARDHLRRPEPGLAALRGRGALRLPRARRALAARRARRRLAGQGRRASAACSRPRASPSAASGWTCARRGSRSASPARSSGRSAASQGARCETLFGTLPSTRRAPCMPRLPSTIRSASYSLAMLDDRVGRVALRRVGLDLDAVAAGSADRASRGSPRR